MKANQIISRILHSHSFYNNTHLNILNNTRRFFVIKPKRPKAPIDLV